MAKIGNLGKLIVFEVSSRKVLTFDNLQRTVKGRWATHDTIGGKPQSEFLGPDNQSITLPIFLSSTHRVKPRVTLDRIAAAVERGETYPLVIGGKKIGRSWKIVSASETWNKVIRNGRLVEARVTLTLEECI